jgi:hypothetical protein
MPYTLPQDRMPEAEVTLRLAFYLLALPNSGGTATVGIDGAHVRVHGDSVFPIAEFLEDEGWYQTEPQGKNSWHGIYGNGGSTLIVTSRPGIGDVVVKVGDHRVRVESKKGPFIKKRGSPEYPLVREAIGQLMTVESVEEQDILAVAVPLTDKFRNLAQKWRTRPLLVSARINIVLVGRDGTVEGLPDLSEGKQR